MRPILFALSLVLLLQQPPARGEPPKPDVQWFDTSADAMGPLLSQKPRVIALGEYHQIRGASTARSSLRHFLDDMLPHLLYWPSDLVVETWVTEGDCGQQEKAVVKNVKKDTKRPKVTENEIVTLITKASQIGIQPHILTISCPDYKSLLDDKGQVDYDKMLVLLTKQLESKVKEVQKKRQDDVRPILVYGGALHNDLYPKEELKNYTFGPKLYKDLQGKYQEVDLYVPEYVEKDPEITAEPWYAVYKAGYQPRKTALIRRGPGSYVIMFPRAR